MLWVHPAATAYANFVRNTCCCQQADSLEGGPRAQGDVVGAAISHSICQLCQKHLICQQAASLEGGRVYRTIALSERRVLSAGCLT